jgi:hypothetical protein
MYPRTMNINSFPRLLGGGRPSARRGRNGRAALRRARPQVDPLEQISLLSGLLPTSTTTAIMDATTNGTPTGVLGEPVYDTATVNGQTSSIPATGTVKYTFSGTGGTVLPPLPAGSSFTLVNGTWQETVTLNANGTVPNSNPTPPLPAGSYQFTAAYSGDSNYSASSASTQGATVLQFGQSNPADSVTATVSAGVTSFSTAGNADGGGVSIPVLITNFLGVGTTLPAFETFVGVATTGPATVGSGVVVQNVVGTIEFTSGIGGTGTNFLTATFTDTALPGRVGGLLGGGQLNLESAGPPDTLTLTSGLATLTAPTAMTIAFSDAVPALSVSGTTLAGFTSQNAGTFSANFVEPLTIAKGSSSTATTIIDAGGGPVTGLSAESVRDTATVTATPPAFTPTGTVTYTFSGTGGTVLPPLPAGSSFTLVNGTWQETVKLNANGTVPNSDATPPLPAGSYQFQAAYSGDTNYIRSTSTPEPLTVTAATPALTWGFWKNHTGLDSPVDAWPVGNFTITSDATSTVSYHGVATTNAQGKKIVAPSTTMTFGGHTYTFAQLQSILGSSVGGNALINLGHQLIGAILNVANGAGTPTAVDLIQDASDLLFTGSTVTPGPLVIGVNTVTQQSDPTLYAQLISLESQLDAFNSSGV